MLTHLPDHGLTAPGNPHKLTTQLTSSYGNTGLKPVSSETAKMLPALNRSLITPKHDLHHPVFFLNRLAGNMDQLKQLKTTVLAWLNGL